MATRRLRAMSVFLTLGTFIQGACLLGYIAAGRVPDDMPKHLVLACFLGSATTLFFAAARRFTYRQLLALALVLACIASASLQVLGHIWFKGIFKDVDFFSLWNLRNIVVIAGIAFFGYALLGTAWHLLMLREPDLEDRSSVNFVNDFNEAAKQSAED